MDKNVFMVRTPDLSVDSTYVLMVQRSPMSGGSSCFLVDELQFEKDNNGQPVSVKGIDKNGLVTQFPYGTPYQLVRRGDVNFMTTLEMAKNQKEEEDAINEVLYPKDKPGTDQPTTEAPRGHQYL